VALESKRRKRLLIHAASTKTSERRYSVGFPCCLLPSQAHAALQVNSIPAAVPETRTENVVVSAPSSLKAAVRPRASAEPEYNPNEDEEGPPASAARGGEEPEYDPADFESDDDGDAEGDADLPQFPITHELALKDHTKVVSALALDPSGARVLSGSHDYDCKLWDFGGMDWRCKPFKTWEPSGSYYVRAFVIVPSHDMVLRRKFYRSMT
jgi:hypothetical protein